MRHSRGATYDLGTLVCLLGYVVRVCPPGYTPRLLCVVTLTPLIIIIITRREEMDLNKDDQAGPSGHFVTMICCK